jgi:hypothetical protein
VTVIEHDVSEKTDEPLFAELPEEVKVKPHSRVTVIEKDALGKQEEPLLEELPEELISKEVNINETVEDKQELTEMFTVQEDDKPLLHKMHQKN